MSNATEENARARELAQRGVILPAPATVDVAREVRLERIAPGVILHAGTRLRGAATSIGPGCVVGAEGPATVEDCRLGRAVALKGGYYGGATFLDGVSFGSSAHVRPGTLLEEGAECAHAVGLKQSILMPFVVTGSLVNFCDVLMAGGTGRADHSEVGSSYVHFNFTPHGDKATASLVGNVPRGVLLDQPRIFLGGQGGLVGPVRIGYGTLIPAGVIQRKDFPEGGGWVCPEPLPATEGRPFRAGAYHAVDRIVRNNLAYIGNLVALRAWYRLVRPRALSRDAWDRACLEGAEACLALDLAERIRRLGELAGKMPRSLRLARAAGDGDPPERPYGQQRRLAERWPALEAALEAASFSDAGTEARDRFLAAWERAPVEQGYVSAVATLGPEARVAATAWLRAIVDGAEALWN